MSEQRILHSCLALAVLAGVAGAQTGAGFASKDAPRDPTGPFDPGPQRMSVRVEPRTDFQRTAAHTWVNVPAAASSFVVHEDDTKVSATFSAEAHTSAPTGRVFVRALLDGQPMNPGSVVFAQGAFDGTQSFTFGGLVDTGVHTVEMQWSVDTTADAFVRDASLLLLTGRRDGAESSLSWTVPPSGPAESTTSQSWSDVPGATLGFFVPQGGCTVLAFSAEAFVGFSTSGVDERMFLRALIDGAPAAPSDVVFTESTVPEARQMSFGASSLTPGWHTAKVQWSSANGGHVYLGDRSLVVSSAPWSPIAGQYFHAPPSGATLVKDDDQWANVPGLSGVAKVPENGEAALSVSAEIKTEPGAVMELRLLDSGAIVSDTVVALGSDDERWGARTFTFDAKHMFAPGGEGGGQTFRVQWRALQGKVYMGDRSIALHVEPGDYPDLAEPGVFGYLPVEPAIGVRPVLTILHFPDDTPPDDTAAPVAEFAEALYGQRGVRDYFEVVSGGRFSIANAGIVGWVQGQKDFSHYYAHSACDEMGSDGFTGGHQERWHEALTAAGAQLDLSIYDTDGDGALYPWELAILIVAPSDEPGGDTRNFAPFCNGSIPTFDGVSVPAIGEWFTSDPLGSWEVAAHELGHLLFSLSDMYVPQTDSWTDPRKLSLMSFNLATTTHLDPATKLALGWAMPIEVEQAGLLEVADVKQSGVVHVLPRRKGGDGKEYFLLENRQTSDSSPLYDEGIGDAGIAVWHVVESAAQHLQAPLCFDQALWESVTNSPARRGVRVIRPLFESGQIGQALWKDANYDLLDHDEVCPSGLNYSERRNILQWADGTAAEWELLGFSAPGPVMSVLVQKHF